jgi:hypothetical protein
MPTYDLSSIEALLREPAVLYALAAGFASGLLVALLLRVLFGGRGRTATLPAELPTQTQFGAQRPEAATPQALTQTQAEVPVEPAWVPAPVPAKVASPEPEPEEPEPEAEELEPEPEPEPAQLEAAKLHAAQPESALQLLGLLQREGRLLDFLQEDIASYTDEQVGSAARGVHDRCKRALDAHLKLERIRSEDEGSRVTVPKGFVAGEIRLVGNVAGEPPFVGELTHAGWRVAHIELPKLSDGHDVHVVAPAEVEL